MPQVNINPSTLYPNPPYLRSKTDKLCLVGQIISQVSPATIIPTPCRTPCELKSPVSPITITFRNQIILTPIGYELLQITRNTGEAQIELANRLLNPHGITIVTTTHTHTPPQETFGIDIESTLESHYNSLNNPS